MAPYERLSALNHHLHAALAPAAVLASHDSDAESSRASSEESELFEELKSFHDPEKGYAPSQTVENALPRASCSNGFRAPLITVGLIVLVLGAFHTGHSRTIRSNTYQGRDLQAVTMNNCFDGTFSPDWGEPVNWLAEAGDGTYSSRTSEHDILLKDLAKNETRTLVKGQDVLDRNGIQLWWQDFALSADGQYILFSSRVTKRWRHSSHSDFYIHDMASASTKPLTAVSEPPQTAIAKWAPHGHALAYVHEEDLYVLPSPSDSAAAIRVTSGANLTIPWVIEEEVLTSDVALWWSPDAARIAFLTFDESRVPIADVPIYNPDPARPDTLPYPDTLSVPYPSVGYSNPTTAAHIYVLATGETLSLDLDLAFAGDDRLVNEVAWITPTDLVIKITDRYGKHLKVVHYDLQGGAAAKVTRDTDYAKIDGGWNEVGQTIIAVPGVAPQGVDVSNLPTGYLDVVPDARGFRHIALFSPADAAEPVFLTSGEWEVVDGIEMVDLRRRLIYFVAAEPSIDRRIRSIPLPDQAQVSALEAAGTAPQYTDLTSEPGSYSVSFSPEGGFYHLTYAGPGVPHSHLFKTDDKAFDIELASNAALEEKLSSHDLPDRTLTTASVGDNEFNVLEIRPPRFDASGKTKYPILFRCYGGPSSQLVSSAFSRDWHTYLASTLGYLVIVVDGRGTGYKGRAFRSPVSGNLGDLEAVDQIAVAQLYSNRSYVDSSKVGIWGWSYGGYLTAKVLERDSGVFTLGMSVAPVTDWRYYDSVYTERYMGDPKTHREAYDKSAVVNMEGFKHAAYFLAHGTGDDNVHPLNSFNLLDRLTMAQVRGFRSRFFVDSDHGMGRRGAYRELHEEMTAFLIENWGQSSNKYRIKQYPHIPVLGDR